MNGREREREGERDNDGRHKLRQGQVLAGILDEHPEIARRAIPARSGSRPDEGSLGNAGGPSSLSKRRPSLWVRMLSALGDEFPRYETAPFTASDADRLTADGRASRGAPREWSQTSTQGHRAR